MPQFDAEEYDERGEQAVSELLAVVNDMEMADNEAWLVELLRLAKDTAYVGAPLWCPKSLGRAIYARIAQ